MKSDKNNVIDTVYKDYVFSEKKSIDGVKIYRFSNETGTGEMQCYNLLEGIQLSYNNLNMETSYQRIKPKQGVLQIDHCLEGCYEVKLENNKRAFMGKGDLSITEVGKLPFESSCIPTKKYVGLSLFIDIDIAQGTIMKYFPYSNINLFDIRDKLCKNGTALVIRSRYEINHIISELYKVDERIRLPYSIIKTMELLLFLSLVESKDTHNLSSFSEPVYRATQECYKALVENPFERYSIFELARKYAISESSLKRCFSYITGTSIGNFIKNTCIEAASELLIHKPDMSVGEIADLAGYLNQGKFSCAFKKYFGETPQQYRNKYI
ncbi:helix-turn-helix domain-containing protein [Johnsonella ignava]|uniref:helix-turn-helix domain-containing protein n=1 Tax=Johnsonella ignava TaxID=43995 RepID=UPI0023EFB9DC|nr:AraC family transcriptional regulator [Johnsonella ignava]